jgi:hypothetical protein
MTNSKLAFVAYPSHDANVLALLREAVSRANAKTPAIRYEPWEFNDIAGEPLISPILNRIDESDFVVADITFLNANVVYEIGYSIAKRKRVFLIRHRNTAGDRELARHIGIFDTLGYFEYEDAHLLANRLTSHINQEPLDYPTKLNTKAPVYVIEPPIKGEAATMMTSRLKKARYKYRSFNPAEDTRLSAVDAIRQVGVSGAVLVSLANSKPWAEVHNLRSMFVAGLAAGMGKPSLILCPQDLDAPLDVRDEVKPYKYPEEITEHIAGLVLDLTEYLQDVEPSTVRLSKPLQQLSFGDPTAENEMTTLGRYYMQTEQYRRALNGEVNLIVGRKGSGKTALFLQLRDRIRADKRNIMVDLKPEGYQLIKLKEDLLQALTEGARQHLITAFWEYLLLLEVTHKVLEKDASTYKHNHELYELYLDLEGTYRANDFSTEGDFSERLLTLSTRIAGEYAVRYGTSTGMSLRAEEVTSLLYVHDLKALKQKLSKYLESKEAVWILFDNLDKGWNTAGVDQIDAIVLRCLIDASRKIQRDMMRRGHNLHCLIFVRNDVYEVLMKESADYGKDMRVALDWTDSELLREMLRLRLVTGIGLHSDTALDNIWRDICVTHFQGTDTVSFMIDHSLMRPRNLLKIFAHIKGFANNLNHDRIEEIDIEKGLRAYSQDLLIELSHELTDVFPESSDVLYRLIDCKPELKKPELFDVLRADGEPPDMLQKLFSFLLYYGVIGLRLNDEAQYIFDVNYDVNILNTRASRLGDDAIYVISPAFRPVLGITESSSWTGNPQKSIEGLTK